MLANFHHTDQETRIIDESFDPEHINNYYLYLYGGDDGLSIAVMDSGSNRFIALQVYAFNQIKNTTDFCLKLRHAIDDSHLLNNPGFKQVSFCYAGTKSTLVPDPLFSTFNAVQYLAFNHPVSPDDSIHSDNLKLLGAKNIFSIPWAVENLMKEKFPHTTIHHHATAFIESLLLNNKNKDEKIVSVYVHLTGFELAVTQRNELILYNSFYYQSSEDFIYYILFTLEQLQLNPETTPFVFTGAAEKSSALYITAGKYIRHIGFAERTEYFSFAEGLESLPSHYHYILFNQQLCAS